MKNTLRQKRIRRQKSVKAKIFGRMDKPRLAIFRSNRFIYAQLIDDEKGKTLASAASSEQDKSGKRKSKTDAAYDVGGSIAEKAAKLGIKKAVFDRRSYAYHGRVKALAEGARKGGLKI